MKTAKKRALILEAPLLFSVKGAPYRTLYCDDVKPREVQEPSLNYIYIFIYLYKETLKL